MTCLKPPLSKLWLTFTPTPRLELQCSVGIPLVHSYFLRSSVSLEGLTVPTHLHASSSCHSPFKKGICFEQVQESLNCLVPVVFVTDNRSALEFQTEITGPRYCVGDHLLWSSSDTRWPLNKLGQSLSPEFHRSPLPAHPRCICRDIKYRVQ